MTTLFERDFLAPAPPWLHPSDRKPTAVVSKTADKPTIIQAAIAAVPSPLITMAVLSAVSFGPAPTARSEGSRATGGQTVAHVSTRPILPADRAWDGYLSKLENGRFTGDHIAAVRTVWEHFRLVNAILVPPQTAPTPEGALTMVWDSGVHHLEVDVDPTSKVGWFYTNRETGKYESGEGSRATHLPRILDEHVKQIV